MNPLFKMPQSLNPFQRIGQVINDVKMLQQNPNQIAQYLSDHGMVNKNQLDEISKMSSPAQVGQYLMRQGVMPQQKVEQAFNTMVPTIRNNM